VTDEPPPEERVDPTPDRDARSSQAAAARRMRDQAKWVEEQIRQAVQRGDFEDLPGLGKPIEGLGTQHDPDWWLKQLVQREQISVLPPALQIRKDDEELDGVLDRVATEDDVRREVADFNERLKRALYATTGWPPVVTNPRDADQEVAAWRARREARVEAQRAVAEPAPPKRRRFRFGRRSD